MSTSEESAEQLIKDIENPNSHFFMGCVSSDYHISRPQKIILTDEVKQHIRDNYDDMFGNAMSEVDPQGMFDSEEASENQLRESIVSNMWRDIRKRYEPTSLSVNDKKRYELKEYSPIIDVFYV